MKISRRGFLTKSAAFAGGLFSVGAMMNCAGQKERPNILWIIAEDLSPDLGCYGNTLVHTPNIDRLASEGALYNAAFCTAPVCSATRSALMTGMYQTSIGAHHHRSHREDGYRLPAGVRFLCDIFRDAGYFTANVTTPAPDMQGTGKTDYNFTVDTPFDGTDWKERASGQPFFAQINFPETHRPFKKAQKNPVNPDDVEIPPCYPDHPITREDWALYLDTAQYLDDKVGAALKRLDDEGLAQNTIVIFFGDHGQPHVRGKQWLYEGGLRIPLIIRAPGMIKPGTTSDELVSLIDVSAQSLGFAGITTPEYMEGRAFLTPGVSEREYIFAARDRCDETMDRIRCVRTKQYKYIRNFMPERPYTQHNRYKETQYPVIRLMRRLHAAGKLTPEQELFMAKTRPPEELYDLENDPYELKNLAHVPEHQTILRELRERLEQWIQETGDRGEIPEDPAIEKYFLERAKQRYDDELKKLQAQEGM